VHVRIDSLLYVVMLHCSVLSVQSATAPAAAMDAAHREHMKPLEQAFHQRSLLLLLLQLLPLVRMIAAAVADGCSHGPSRTLN
jgi:hypothetical protein